MRRETLLAMIIALTLIPVTVFAKDLDAGDALADPGSGMPTLQEIHDYLVSGTEPSGVEMFQEPTTGPRATMKTLKQLYDDFEALLDLCTVTPDKVLKGQTFFRTGGTWGPQEGTMPYVGQQTIIPGTAPQPIWPGYHDGSGRVIGDPELVPYNIRAGIKIFGTIGIFSPCDPACSGTLSAGGRWCNNGDGTVTDMLTGLIWLQNANCFGPQNWEDAGMYTSRTKDGVCGLSDGSDHYTWRLPMLRELSDLMEGSEAIRSDSPGPFSNVQSGRYWSATTAPYYQKGAVYFVNLGDETGGHDDKTVLYYVWPVRRKQ